MRSKPDIKKAFTLIELIIFMGIFSILIFIFSDIFVSSIETKTSGEATAFVNQDSDFVLAKLEYDIHNSGSISQPALGQTGNVLVMNLDGSPVQYQLSGGKLQRLSGGNTNDLNSYRTVITGITFTNIGNATGKSTIRINMTMQSTELTNGKPQVINLQTTAGLR